MENNERQRVCGVAKCGRTKLSNGIFYVKRESNWLYTMYDAILDALANVRGVFGKTIISFLFFCIVFDMAKTGDAMGKLFKEYEFTDFLVDTASLFLVAGSGFLMLFYIIEMFEVALSKRYTGRVPVHDLSFTVVYFLVCIFGSELVLVMGYKTFLCLISLIPLGYLLPLILVHFLFNLLFILVKKVLYHFRKGYIQKHLTDGEMEKYLEI